MQYLLDSGAPDAEANSRLMMTSEENDGVEEVLNNVPLGVKVKLATDVPELETKKL
jgi:hypothetical protein